MTKEIINRVEKSGLINIDLSNFITNEVVELDICCFLTENNIVIEKNLERVYQIMIGKNYLTKM